MRFARCDGSGSPARLARPAHPPGPAAPPRPFSCQGSVVSASTPDERGGVAIRLPRPALLGDGATVPEHRPWELIAMAMPAVGPVLRLVHVLRMVRLGCVGRLGCVVRLGCEVRLGCVAWVAIRLTRVTGGCLAAGFGHRDGRLDAAEMFVGRVPWRPGHRWCCE